MLDTEARQKTTYFVGIEVENTPLKGEKTLFVVGIRPVAEIVGLATKHDVKHVYFGTSQSYTPSNVEELLAWEDMITGVLRSGLWATLDFGVDYIDQVHESVFNEFDNFIPMISVKIPYISLLNYNAVLKIDDTTWGHSNPGVWCHPLHELQTRATYTDWREYVGDTNLEIDNE